MAAWPSSGVLGAVDGSGYSVSRYFMAKPPVVVRRRSPRSLSRRTSRAQTDSPPLAEGSPRLPALFHPAVERVPPAEQPVDLLLAARGHRAGRLVPQAHLDRLP